MNYGVVLRNTFPELRTSTQKVFLDLVDLYYKQYEASRNMQENWIKFKNGSLVQFLHSSSEDIFYGPELGWYVVDQAEAVPEKIADHLTHRLRKPGYPQQGIYVGNTTRGKNWCYRWFVRKERANTSYHHITILDNIENLGSDYVRDLMSRPDSWKKVFLFGSWDAPGGIILPFQKEHFFPSMECPHDWYKVLAVDPADGMGYCAAIASAVDWNGWIWLFKGYKAKERHVAEHARNIKALWGGKEGICYFDPSAWRRQSVPSDTGKDEWITMVDRYRAYGLYPVPAENAIMPSIDMIQDRMALNMNQPHPITKMPGAPGIYVCEDLVDLIEENTQWTWETIDAEDIHQIDCVRYTVASRPPTPQQARRNTIEQREYGRPRDDNLSWMGA